MTIYHISAECYPVAKVGGLADVVGALPKYQNLLNTNTCVVIPKYDTVFFKDHSLEKIYEGTLKLGQSIFNFTVLKLDTKHLGFDLYSIDIPLLFNRPNVYGYHDDTERFTAFQIAFLNWLVHTHQCPSVLHCHDHHTALIPFMVQYCYQYYSLKNVPTVLTIHNAQYQGWFSFEKMDYLPDFEKMYGGYLEWDGVINPLASGIKCAQHVTTVSPTYLEELSYKANGLENLLQYEKGKCTGILNGIDTAVWNTNSDFMLTANYTQSNYKQGKKSNKEALCEHFNLNPNKPLFTFIGRLVGEKGAELLPQICSIALSQYNGELNILLLGSGDPEVENNLRNLQHFYPSNYNVYIGYNEKLAHNIYAGADFLLMPSRVEPCGLNQMYALRYGTIPIVRRTGGLKDTVIDIGDGGFGICHDQTSVQDVMHAINRAIALYNDTQNMDHIVNTAMTIDYSWDKVASQYNNLYHSIINQ